MLFPPTLPLPMLLCRLPRPGTNGGSSDTAMALPVYRPVSGLWHRSVCVRVGGVCVCTSACHDHAFVRQVSCPTNHMSAAHPQGLGIPCAHPQNNRTHIFTHTYVHTFTWTQTEPCSRPAPMQHGIRGIESAHCFPLPPYDSQNIGFGHGRPASPVCT